MKHAFLRTLFLLGLLVVLFLILFRQPATEEAAPPEIAGLMAEHEPQEAELFEGDFFDVPVTYEGSLDDVTGGEASGFARAGYDDVYQLEVTFEDLPELEAGFFYEGWVVRRSPFAFISTGALVPHADGGEVNVFASMIDYTPYDFYVLTLEPDDGDPAPAEHILEGELAVK